MVGIPAVDCIHCRPKAFSAMSYHLSCLWSQPVRVNAMSILPTSAFVIVDRFQTTIISVLVVREDGCTVLGHTNGRG